MAEEETDYYSAEYPLALEYRGPPVGFRIPKVMPLDLSLIPVAPPTPRKVTRWSSKIVYDRGEEIAPSPLAPLSPAPSSPLFSTPSPSGGSSASPARVSVNGEESRRRRKGACKMCGKGNRYTEKERCISCGARYCAGCVLRAMGSMPEGRKCLGCVGAPIDEARRGRLGKKPQVIRKVLSRREVEQVMRAEMGSEVNRVRPDSVFVNGVPLEADELAVLESCGISPGTLRPGRYWYDKMCGFWGVEGQCPQKIISHNMNIGGTLQEMASNGNTGILINGRRITKSEMILLKFAGAQCAGSPQYWLDANGDYQEEGQRNIQGNLWSKRGTKLICCALLLPFPFKGTEIPNEPPSTMRNALLDRVQEKKIQGLLLIGCHGSGASTIFKQANFLYKSVPFTEEERESIKVMIQCSTYRYLGMVLEGREQFEEECLRCESGDQSQQNIYSLSRRLKEFSDWFLGIIYSGVLEVFFPASNREYFPLVKKLWKSTAIQATYKRRHELHNLPSIASYFLEKVVDIVSPEYEVSNKDILYADWVVSSNGMAHTELKIPHSDDDDSHEPHPASNLHEAVRRYELIMVHTRSLSDGNYKWLDMFENAQMVIFCVALTDYNEYHEDAKGNLMNKMLANRNLFEKIATHTSLRRKNFLLALNKFDLLEQKIEHAPLTLCNWFSDFNPVKRGTRRAEKNTLSAEQAFHYIASKFKALFAALTGRRLYVILTNGLDSNSVGNMFRHAREILMWEEEKAMLDTFEVSNCTDPTMSVSH